MSFLLLGEAPNAATANKPHLWLMPDRGNVKHSANALRDYAGYTHREYVDVFSVRENVLRFAPPRTKSGGGYTFPMREARAAAVAVLDGRHDDFKNGRLHGIVVLGMRTARALRWHSGPLSTPMKDPPPFFSDWHFVGGSNDNWYSAVVVPHPSGFNRWWNDPSNRRAARKFFMDLRHYHDVKTNNRPVDPR